MNNSRPINSAFLRLVSAIILIFSLAISSYAQLQTMLGFVGMRSARIWVAAPQECAIGVAVFIPGSKAPERIFTANVQQNKGNSCIVDLEGLEPGLSTDTESMWPTILTQLSI